MLSLNHKVGAKNIITSKKLIGDFSHCIGKPLQNFIYEYNKTCDVFFASDRDKIAAMLSHKSAAERRHSHKLRR